MADKILSQMAMFDFSAPVETVTVFDDDSNDEKYFPSPKKRKIQSTIATHILHDEVDIVSSSDKDILQNDVKIECALYENSVPANYTEKNSQNNPKQTNMEISKQKENCYSELNSIQCEENVISGSNNDENRNEQQSLQELTKSVNNENVSKEPIPDQVNTVTSFNYSSRDSDMQEMACYLKELMHIVSEILLKILEAYRLYINVQNTGNPIIVEKSRLYYIQTKHHFFKLAFLIVKTIFIPQNHLYTFGRNFIECTLRISKKNLLKNTYQEIETIYLEMIEWTKERCKDFERKTISYFTQLTQNTLKFTEMTKEKAPTSYINNTPVYKNININCPPVPQQKVNISPGLPTNTNNSPLQYNLNISPEFQPNVTISPGHPTITYKSPGLQQNVNIPPRHPINLNNSPELQQNGNTSSGLHQNVNMPPRHPIKNNSPGIQQLFNIAPRLPINLNNSTGLQQNGHNSSRFQRNVNIPPRHSINLNNSNGHHPNLNISPAHQKNGNIALRLQQNINIPPGHPIHVNNSTGLQKNCNSLPGQQNVNELNVHQKNTTSSSGQQKNDAAISGRQKNVVQPQNQPNTVYFTSPSYNEANNLQRNSVANVENYVYSHHSQPQNYNQHPQSLPSVTYPGGFYNNLQNSTYTTSTNIPCRILNHAPCHQTQSNNDAPKYSITIRTISPPATSRDMRNEGLQ